MGERPLPQPLTRLTPGQAIVVGGDRVVAVDSALAEAFRPGDRLVVIGETGDVLHVRAADAAAAKSAVGEAVGAFAELAACTDDDITSFFDVCAANLADDRRMGPVFSANACDVTSARERGRSTTRLELTEQIRADMIEGLKGWATSPTRRDEPLARIAHEGWALEARRAPLGVVGFVFEGRPNVFADATGVLRTGNTVVLRIGSDALDTAAAVIDRVIAPALADAGLPAGSVSLVRSASRASGWALFDDRRLALAVARGSGTAVAQLGAVARQAGIPASLHGTGGAWLVAGHHADADWLARSLVNSLDRKVCNTTNVVCIAEARAADLVPVVLRAVDAAGAARQVQSRLHVTVATRPFVPDVWFAETVTVVRAGGAVQEPKADVISDHDLATEWEWEDSPELSLAVVADVDAAVAACNRYSPHFVASLVSVDPDEHERFYQTVDAPFVGDGFTRWVDGQYALGTPELGLSNWEAGRLLSRSAILSGASMHTVRYRASIEDPETRR